MLLSQISDIENILLAVLKRITNGPFDIHVTTLSDVYNDGVNIGGAYKIKTTNINISNVNVNLSNKDKPTHWRDCIEIFYNNHHINFGNDEKLENLLIAIVDYFKKYY